MGMTIPQRIAKVRAAEVAGWLLPDTSEILHTFDDGWTIRAPLTAGDHGREGYAMHNCCGRYVYGDLDPATPFSMADRDELSETLQRARLISLRDSHNLPHASMWLLDEHIYFALGPSDDPVKEHCEKRLVQWAKETGRSWWGKHTGDGISLADLVRTRTPEEGPQCPPHLAMITHAARVNPEAPRVRMERTLDQCIEHCAVLAVQYPDVLERLEDIQMRAAAIWQIMDNVEDDLVHELERSVDRTVDDMIALDDELFERTRAQERQSA